jgi:hypothetical protein
MVNSLALAYMGSQTKTEQPKSILDKAAETVPAAPAPAAPAPLIEAPAKVPASNGAGTPAPK